MKIFVTGVCGQLGHDVVNELISRGHEAVGSDVMPPYAGVDDGSAVTKAPYVSLDITDRDAVLRPFAESKAFEEYPVDDGSAGWAQAVMSIVRELDAHGTDKS